MLIGRDLYLTVGGYHEKMPRMEDIELGYRLFRHGAKLYYSERPWATHREAETGGTRKSQSDMRRARLRSALYLHMKHFPGWTTRQHLQRAVLNGLLYRDLTTGRSEPITWRRMGYPVSACRWAKKSVGKSPEGGV